MTTVSQDRTLEAGAVRSAHRPWCHFALHFGEMVAAMVAGMVVLGLAVKPIVAHIDVLRRSDMSVLIMATNMAIGMSLWMRFRKHSWASIAEMDAAMYLPFVALLVPYWAGLIPGGTLMVGGHALMLPAMAAVMLRRRDEFAGSH
jgi:flagellar biosynthetic protein FliP